MIRRIQLTLLALFVGVWAMAAGTSVKNADGVEIWYNFNSYTKKASVTYRGNNSSSYSNEYTGEVVIPSTVTYEGVEYSVTSIGGDAFYGCSTLASITIPEGVTSIGGDAFSYCSSLTSITIPEGVIKIGDYAFYDCNSLTSITIPESVTSIGDYAFKGCSSLTSITIPENVTSIGSSAFYKCGSLTSIDVALDNNNYTSIDGVLFNKDKTILIKYPEGKKDVTSYALPESVTSIVDYAFYYCHSLTSITIPDGVTEIGSSAFFVCYKLYEVYNKSNLTITAGSSENGYVADYAKNVYTDESGESKLKTVGDYIFYEDEDNIELLAYIGDETAIILPSDYEGKDYIIANYAFYDCSTLTSITIPESVTLIGSYAFDGCSSLTSITIPEGVTSIGSYAFHGCSSLTSITIPKGVTSIGENAFSYCSFLTSITLPEGVTKIGYSAFECCRSLTSISLPESVTEIRGSTFRYCSSLTSITIPKGVTSIIGYAFCECHSLTSVTIPDGVTSIEDYAFKGCYKLYEVYNKSNLTITAGSSENGGVAYYAKNVYTDDSVESKLHTVGDYIFYVNEDYEGVDIIELLAYIGDEIAITLPSDYEGKNYKIVDYAFYDCDYLIRITIPEGVTEIGNSAFQDCSSLTSITIPEGVTEIEDDAFNDCSSLTSITIPEGVTWIGSAAFWDCSSLTSITIPESVTEIGSAAFWDCSSLTSVIIPEGVIEIGTFAFDGCSSLTSITSMNVTPPLIYDGSGFNGVDKSIPVYVPKQSVEAYKSAKYWKKFTNIQGIDDTLISDVVADSVSIRLIGNSLIVEGAESYAVYALSGQCLGKVESLERGLYIVVADGVSKKIVVK